MSEVLWYHMQGCNEPFQAEPKETSRFGDLAVCLQLYMFFYYILLPSAKTALGITPLHLINLLCGVPDGYVIRVLF